MSWAVRDCGSYGTPISFFSQQIKPRSTNKLPDQAIRALAFVPEVITFLMPTPCLVLRLFKLNPLNNSHASLSKFIAPLRSTPQILLKPTPKIMRLLLVPSPCPPPVPSKISYTLKDI